MQCLHDPISPVRVETPQKSPNLKKSKTGTGLPSNLKVVGEVRTVPRKRYGREPDADVAASERDSSDNDGNDVKDVHDDASEGSSTPAQEQRQIMEADEVVCCHDIGLKADAELEASDTQNIHRE